MELFKEYALVGIPRADTLIGSMETGASKDGSPWSNVAFPPPPTMAK